jgi:hypothetical protein
MIKKYTKFVIKKRHKFIKTTMLSGQIYPVAGWMA